LAGADICTKNQGRYWVLGVIFFFFFLVAVLLKVYWQRLLRKTATTATAAPHVARPQTSSKTEINLACHVTSVLPDPETQPKRPKQRPGVACH
jgi:hypothetical protein